MLLLSIVFLVIRVLPGDPVLLHFEKYERPEAIAEMRHNLGLDKPLWIQYFDYLGSLLRLDLGKSMQDYSPVGEQIFSAFPATLELAIYSMVIAVVLGVLLGVRAAKKYNSAEDHAIRGFGIITYAIPVFFLGMIFQLFFGIYLRWLPTGTRIPPTMEPYGLRIILQVPRGGFLEVLTWSFIAGLASLPISFVVLRMKKIKLLPRGLLITVSILISSWLVWSYAAWYFSNLGGVSISTGLYTIDSLLEGDMVKFVQAFRSLLLPSLTLGVVLCGIFLRLTRSNMLETLRLDFVTAAKARGLKDGTVTYSYALRNAFLPVLTMMGLQFAALLGGAILTETTFSWPGLGKYIVDRIHFRDYTAIQGAVVFFGVLVAFVSLAVDVLYAFLDPRIRL
jgi:ABC-type dipeptide/oligopeptide/nickel transport system permease component